MAANTPADSLVRKLARQNAAELAALPDAPGPEHIMAFAESARSYGRRLPQSWDLIHHSYRATDVTVGAMAGAACAEWACRPRSRATRRPRERRLPGAPPRAWPGPTTRCAMSSFPSSMNPVSWWHDLQGGKIAEQRNVPVHVIAIDAGGESKRSNSSAR